MEGRTVRDLPEGKARSHAIRRMEEAYVKVQKVYNLMGTGFDRMSVEDFDEVCVLLRESYDLMAHARRNLVFGFDKERVPGTNHFTNHLQKV